MMLGAKPPHVKWLAVIIMVRVNIA